MTLYHGASHDLEGLINTHLFVLCPNNSGTTFLKAALATSKQTWNLHREGQRTFGFSGPSAHQQRMGKVWAHRQDWIETLTDPAAFNWSTTRKAWYFQAFSGNPEAGIFVEKSPQFLLIADQLRRHFHHARFILMVRNPYATIEGVCRRLNTMIDGKPRHHDQSRHDLSPDADVLELAATHVMTCFRYQRHNIDTHSDRATLFTYEAMCDTPAEVEQQIHDLIPALDDLVLQQHIPVKDYNEPLRNMNAQQIARLTARDLSTINSVLERHREEMDFFGYNFIPAEAQS